MGRRVPKFQEVGDGAAYLLHESGEGGRRLDEVFLRAALQRTENALQHFTEIFVDF
jgi:hypothetical protein